MKSEGAEIWRRRVEGLAASGKSCREYAAELGVNPHTLAGWRWKLQGSPATATAYMLAPPGPRVGDSLADWPSGGPAA